MKKPNNKQRKGFTIVELVIVIAVVAVLAGVMIPTFGGIIESANRSADTQLVAQINTILAVENLLHDDGNDVVEIQKLVKENGLKLETKSKGAYIWYDVDKSKVVLAGLNANGIVLEEKDKDPNDPATKGQFAAATAPEDFVEGYLFLSEKSPDGLAEKICALRSPEGADDAAISTSLSTTLQQISDLKDKVDGAEQVAQTLSALIGTTAVMTSNGLGYIGNDKSAVIRVIISADMTEVTADSIGDLLAKDDSGNEIYPYVKYVSFHSNIVNITDTDADSAIDLIIANSDKYFFYCNEEIRKIDEDDNGDIPNLARIDEFNKYFRTIVVMDSIDNTEIKKWSIDADTYTITYTGLEYAIKAGTADTSYDFIGYSLYRDGRTLLELCDNAMEVKTYTLKGEEKVLIEGNDENSANNKLIIYRVYRTATSDFKVGDAYYSSASMTYMLAKTTVANDIVVIGTNAKLDASLIGQDSANLTIPSKIALWVPCSKTNFSGRSNGAYYPTYVSSEKANYGTFNKDNDDGANKLTIASNVTLTNKGYITVDAQLHQEGDSAHFGFISYNSGVLVVNGKIINNSGSRMEAYGVVRTESNGSVDAEAGSTVTEIMSVLDLHGGSTTLAATVNNISPFNNYTVDSIRLPLTVKYGATYTTYGVIEAEGVHSLDFKIAGSTGTPDQALSTNPLFLMHSGAEIVKSYDKNNGIHVTISGEVEDCIKMIDIDVKEILSTYLKDNYGEWAQYVGRLVGSFVAFDGISFAVIPMPLPDFDITIKEGATLSLSKATYKLLPGSDWVVEKGGTLELNCSMIVYDSFVLDGGGKTVQPPRIYNETNGNAFTKENATLTVNGTLDLQSGAKLAGTITGGANDAKIIVASTNNLSCPEIKEGANGQIGMELALAWPPCKITGSIDKYSVKDFDWTAKCVQANSARPQAITTAKTYTFNGSIWE